MCEEAIASNFFFQEGFDPKNWIEALDLKQSF